MPSQQNRFLAGILQDLVIELQETAKAEDFLTGYSLSTAIEDRISQIGTVEAASQQLADSKVQRSSTGRPTDQARLKLLAETAKITIEAARDAIMNPDISILPDSNTYVVDSDSNDVVVI
jgi:hypothetical protein